MYDKFWHDIIALRHHQKQSHVTITFNGIQVSMQYRVSVPILNDICTLVPLFLSHMFYHSSFIAILYCSFILNNVAPDQTAPKVRPVSTLLIIQIVL